MVDLRDDYGYDIPTAGRKGSRSTCAVCGLSKRYVFNKAAAEGGFDVIATGHNLDDEAATLLGNTLRWNTEYIARQSPALPAKDGMVKKVKPLHRLSELETAAYAFLRGIDYVVEECPLVAGNTQLRYKEAMNTIEATSQAPRPTATHKSRNWLGVIVSPAWYSRRSSSGPPGMKRARSSRRRRTSARTRRIDSSVCTSGFWMPSAIWRSRLRAVARAPVRRSLISEAIPSTASTTAMKIRT